MPNGHAVLKFMRKVHLYLGIFTTPALLFFAFTGAAQTFSLHETTQGRSYKPPAWMAAMAQLHKKQTTTVPVRRMRPADEGDAAGRQGNEPVHPRAEGHREAPPAQAPSGTPGQAASAESKAAAPALSKSYLPMKVFFLLVAVSLALSTLTGVYMSYKYNRGWWLLTGFLVAGLVVPLALLPH